MKIGSIDTCFGLLDLIHRLEEIIAKQNQTIVKLVNENAEQENMINVLLQESNEE